MSTLVLDLYTQDNCPYCVQMKMKLDEWGYAYREINISRDSEAKWFLKENKHRTVPQLYYGHKHLNTVDTDNFTKEILESRLEYYESI